MWLKRQYKTAVGKRAPRGCNGGRHLHRMMTVVVDQRELSITTAASIGRQINFTVALKTPIHAPEACQRPNYGCVRQPYLVAYRDGGQRVLHVMQTGQIKRDFELPRPAVDAYQSRKMHFSFAVANIGGANLRRVR